MKQFIEIKRGAKMPRLGMGTWFLGENPHRRNQEIEALRGGVEAGIHLDRYGRNVRKRSFRGNDRGSDCSV